MQKLKKKGGGRGGGERKFLWIFDVVVKKFFLRVKLKNYIYISNICITSSKNWKKNIRRIFNDIQSYIYIYIIEIKISLRLDVEKLYLHYFLHESKISSRVKEKKKKEYFARIHWI